MAMLRSVTVKHQAETPRREAKWSATWRPDDGKPVRVTGPADTGEDTKAEITAVLEDLMGAVDAAVCEAHEYGVWGIPDVEYRLTGACSDSCGAIYTVMWDHGQMQKARKLADILRDGSLTENPPWETPYVMRDLHGRDIELVLNAVADRHEEIRFGDPSLPLGGGSSALRAREIALDAINEIKATV